MIYASQNSHLGDIAWHCQILQLIGGSHEYYVPEEYAWQVREMVNGLVDVEVLTSEAPKEALSTWIACGRFEDRGVRYEHNIDLIEYLCRWGNEIARENGSEFWFERGDLLASFPAILRNFAAPEFDVLVVNSPPRSGQCPRWEQREMDCLIHELSNNCRVIQTNTPYEMFLGVIKASLCNIGNLSLRAKLVIAVAAGPAFGALNVWRTCPIYLLLDPIRLDYGEAHPVTHCASVGELRERLTKDGWL